ncbi:MAG: dihydrolipoyl dehydrogenase [bacterium]
MPEFKKYEVIVLGGGPGGYSAAIRAGALGKKVLVIEKDKVGGTCLNWGCIPTKALLSATEFLEEAAEWRKAGISMDGVKVDVPALQKWNKGIVSKLVGGVEALFKGNGVEWVRGAGQFVGPKQIKAATAEGDQFFEGDAVIIATGSEPTPLPTLPCDGKLILNSDQALFLDAAPKSMLVVGAGAVGLELATVYNRLGTKIVVIELMPQIIPGVDKDLATQLHRALKKRGMDVFVNSKVVDYKVNGAVSLRVETPEGAKTWEVDTVLVAVGRRAVTQGIGLDKTGIQTDDHGFISVGTHRETNQSGIYAIGDITGHPMLAHKAMKEGVVAAETICGLDRVFDFRSIPGVVYTEPEVAWAGLTEDEAKTRGMNIAVGQFPFVASGRALTMNHTEGFVKIVADQKTDLLLGMHILGHAASEFMGEASLAIEMGATAHDIGYSIHPHPTLSEGIMEAAEYLHGKAIHIMNRK